MHDVPAQLRNEIEHFFQVYKDLESGKTETSGFGNRAEAQVDRSRRAASVSLQPARPACQLAQSRA